jgi:hypothetical protein
MVRRNTRNRHRSIERLDEEIESKLQKCIEHLVAASRLEHEIDRLLGEEPDFEPGFDRTVALGAITDQLGSLCGPKLWLLAKLGDVVTEIVDVDQASERMDGGDTVVH